MRGIRSSAEAKRQRGTINVTRERERQARALGRRTEPSPEMRRAPAGLTAAQRRLYRRTVVAAPWIEPADLSSLVMWVKAFDAVIHAEDLKSVKSEASLAANLGRQLGLTPLGRMALGIANQPSAAPAGNDPWAELRRPLQVV